MSESTIKDLIATKANWASQFKPNFLYKLKESFGEVSNMIARGEDLVLAEPDRMRMLDVRARDGVIQVRYYADEYHGAEQFRIDRKRFENLQQHKRESTGYLMKHLDQELQIAVTNTQGYDEAFADNNILALYTMAEHAAVGAGAASIYTYLTRLISLNMKAPGAAQLDKYSKDHREYRQALGSIARQQAAARHAVLIRGLEGEAARAIAVPNASEILLQAMFDTLYVLNLNKEQFKDRLREIYSANNWPTFEALSAELKVGAEAEERIKNAKSSQEEEGKVTANYVKKDRKMLCYNCGKDDHLVLQCKEPKHTCKWCGRRHLEQFCKEEWKQGASSTSASSAEENSERKKLNRNTKKFQAPSKPNKKEIRKPKRLSRALLSALVSELGFDEEEEEDDVEEAEEDLPDDEEGGLSLITIVEDTHDPHENHPTSTALVSLEKMDPCREEVFVVDSGCVGANICRDHTILRMKRENSNATVKGLSSSIASTHVGQIPIGGKTFASSQASANLLSLRAAIAGGGSFEGDENKLNVYDNNHVLTFSAYNRGDGFWSCTLGELEDAALRSPNAKALVGELDYEEPHFSAEEKSRAKEARTLCPRLGHPGLKALCKLLDENMVTDTHLTSTDVRNSRAIHGPCPGCTEGKMTAPREPTSLTPPATRPGQVLHMDFYIYNKPTLGGNNYALFCTDEKTGACYVQSIKNKAKATVCEGMTDIIAEFSSRRHRVDTVITDSEPVFMSCKTHLNTMGIVAEYTTPGLHEKRVERHIRTVKEKLSAMKASLDYELPDGLEGELLVQSVKAHNCVPCEASGNSTPLQLVTGLRPSIPLHYFGQVGLFYKTTKDSRAEWGIYIGTNQRGKKFRGYLPMRKAIFQCRKFIPMDHVPPEWGLKKRIRPVERKDRTPSTPNANVQTGLPLAPSPLKAADLLVDREDSIDQEGDNAKDQEGDSARDQKGDLVNADRPLIVPTPPLNILAQNPIQEVIPVTAPTPPEEPAPHIEPPAPSPQKRRKKAKTPSQDIPVPPPPSMPNIAEAPTDTFFPSGRPKRSTMTTHREGSRKLQGLPSISEEELAALVSSSRSLHDIDVEKAKRELSKKAAKRLETLKRNVINWVYQPHGAPAATCYRMSLRKGLKDPDKAEGYLKAAYDEINNMEKGKVLNLVKYKDIPLEYRANILPLHMFLKDKFLASGEFDKAKARLVTGGHLEDPLNVGNTFSPTANPISVMTLLNIVASNLLNLLSAYDIKGAFLLASLPPGKRVFVKIPPDVTALWINKYPERKAYLVNGCMYAELDKCLYGLKEAPNAFHKLLNDFLEELGFKASRADPCLYKKETKEGPIVICVWVDDILVSSPSKRQQKWFEGCLEERFEIVRQYNNISYLGMQISKRDNGSITVDQAGYINDILKKHNVRGLSKPPPTPATADLFNIDASSPTIDKSAYLSDIMTLMFLARFTRPDILVAVSFLASRSANPTEEDQKKLERVIKYLYGTRNKKITFTKPNMILQAYADASHATHPDAKGHSGLILSLGSGPIFSRSSKLKCTTRSSTESELVALEDAATYVVWMRELLEDLGFAQPTTEIFQDNKSTIVLAQKGGNFKRTKHIMCKEWYIRDLINDNKVKLTYKSTKLMLADLLTKPLDKTTTANITKALQLM